MPTFADPDRQLEHHEQVLALLEKRAQGKSTKQAAIDLGISQQHAGALVREAIEQVKRDQADLITQRRLEHDAKLEYLYNVCLAHVQALVAANAFDDKAIRCAVSILERQSRLWGLDLSGTKTSEGRADWLDTASSSAVLAEAERYGLKVPEPFRVKMGAK